MFEFAIIAFLSVVIYIARDPDNPYLNKGTDVDKNVLFWIVVYCGVYVVYAVRRIIVLCQWMWKKDPRTTQAKINCCFCLFVNTFEVLWFVFGTMLFFGQDGDFSKSDHLK